MNKPRVFPATPRDPVLVRLFRKIGLPYEEGVQLLRQKIVAMVTQLRAEQGQELPAPIADTPSQTALTRPAE